MKKQPSFRVELERNDYLAKQRRKEQEMIRDSLFETNSSPVWVGKQGQPVLKRKIQPHNYRLYFDFDKSSFNPTRAGFDFKNHNSEAHLQDLMNGCKIIIRKTTAEVINLNSDGRYILIQANTLQEIDDRVIEVTNFLDSQCIDALKEFIRMYGGFSSYEFKRSPMQENGIKLDEYIDNIPERLVWKDFPFSKKVYKDKTEIYTIQHTRNYLKNRAIENIAPEIAEEITELRKENNLLLWIKSQIHKISDLFNCEKDVRRLSQDEKTELENFLLTLNKQ